MNLYDLECEVLDLYNETGKKPTTIKLTRLEMNLLIFNFKKFHTEEENRSDDNSDITCLCLCGFDLKVEVVENIAGSRFLV